MMAEVLTMNSDCVIGQVFPEADCGKTHQKKKKKKYFIKNTSHIKWECVVWYTVKSSLVWW